MLSNKKPGKVVHSCWKKGGPDCRSQLTKSGRLKLVFWSEDMSRREIEVQVRLADVAPTILDLLEVPTLDHCDGRSLASAIRDGSVLPPVPACPETFCPREQNEVSDSKFEWMRCKNSIRIENWYKNIMHVGDEAMEICDLRNDPVECNNLLAA